MYRKILDGSELAGKAVEHGVALAKAIGASITFLTVTRPYRAGTIDTAAIEDTPAEYEARIAAKGRQSASNRRWRGEGRWRRMLHRADRG
jgi:nucleotide-binding universal stress UspA family protein